VFVDGGSCEAGNQRFVLEVGLDSLGYTGGQEQARVTSGSDRNSDDGEIVPVNSSNSAVSHRKKRSLPFVGCRYSDGDVAGISLKAEYESPKALLKKNEHN